MEVKILRNPCGKENSLPSRMRGPGPALTQPRRPAVPILHPPRPAETEMAGGPSSRGLSPGTSEAPLRGTVTPFHA